MRLFWSLSALVVASSSVAAFAPSSNNGVVARSSALHSTVAAADVKAKQDASFEKLRAKDQSSGAITKDVSASLVEGRARDGDHGSRVAWK